MFLHICMCTYFTIFPFSGLIPVYISNRNLYYIPYKVYIVKLPLTLTVGNMSYLIESILTQSHDDAKNPHGFLALNSK